MELLRERIAIKLNRVIKEIIDSKGGDIHLKKNPESIFQMNEFKKQLEECIKKLDHAYRLTFLIAWEKDITYKELAEGLSEAFQKNVTEDAIKARISRGSKSVVNCMENAYQVS